MEKLNDVCRLKHDLIDEAIRNKDSYSIEQMGEVVDMIKDLAEAEEKCVKACYYHTIINAMHDESDDRYGYDHWRYSSGRFAPKGKGKYGYRPGDVFWENPDRMGYDNTMNRDHLDKWRDARRNYQSSHSKSDKDVMDTHANAHVNETVATLKEIMDSSDPELQRKIKNSLTNLINDG